MLVFMHKMVSELCGWQGFYSGGRTQSTVGALQVHMHETNRTVSN